MSFLVYAESLTHDFIWDDYYEILKNPWIRDIKYLPNILFSNSLDWTPYSGTPRYGPAKLLVHLMLYSVFGSAPWGYHLTNVLLHLASSLTLFLVAEIFFKRLYKEDRLIFPAAAALIFAVHPIHTEAVNWVSGLAELNMSLFFMLSLVVYIKTDGIKYSRMISSGVLFFIAILFKFTVLSCLPLFFLYDYSVRKKEERSGPGDREFWRTTLLRHVPFIVAGIVFFAIFYYVTGDIAPSKGKTAMGFTWEFLINIFPLFSKYLELLLLPLNLNALYVFHPFSSISETVVLASVLVTVIFLGAVAIALRREQGLFWGLLFVAFPLIPCLYLPAVGYSYYVFAERYLYLPSAGFALALPVIARYIYIRLPGKVTAQMLGAALGIVLVLGTVLTLERNPAWKNGMSFWSDIVLKSPDSAIAHNNLGVEYANRNMLVAAMKEFEAAVAIDPTYSDAQMSLINLKRNGVKY